MFLIFPRLRLRISIFALPVLLIIFWLEGFLPFLVMVLSAVVHEFGHLTALHLLGYRARRIDVLPMGALIVVPEGVTYKDEFTIAVSGPLTSLVCALISALVFFLKPIPIVLFACVTNLVFAIFNLLPERKLDGGKALWTFLINKKSTEETERICSAVSMLSKTVFSLFVLTCAIQSGMNPGVLIVSFSLIFQFLSN